MEFALLVYGAELAWTEMTAEERRQHFELHRDFGADLRRAGVRVVYGFRGWPAPNRPARNRERTGSPSSVVSGSWTCRRSRTPSPGRSACRAGRVTGLSCVAANVQDEA
ncbi:hypothetical protein [Microbispora sp. CA-102843]|uniref:hypothetical protein n=1 Tax=Microbispora sp. CA-102843 TaxID=3239952 RepID=UPI003D929948